MNRWVLRLSVTAVILAASIAVSLLVSPWFFLVLFVFPFELLWPVVRRRKDDPGPQD